MYVLCVASWPVLEFRVLTDSRPCCGRKGIFEIHQMIYLLHLGNLSFLAHKLSNLSGVNQFLIITHYAIAGMKIGIGLPAHEQSPWDRLSWMMQQLPRASGNAFPGC